MPVYSYLLAMRGVFLPVVGGRCRTLRHRLSAQKGIALALGLLVDHVPATRTSLLKKGRNPSQNTPVDRRPEIGSIWGTEARRARERSKNRGGSDGANAAI